MNRLSRTALGAVFACALVPAHAFGTYAASFTVEEWPRLRTGTSVDGPDTVNGDWGPNDMIGTNVFVREASGFAPHPFTGKLEPVWVNWPTPMRETSPSGPLGFGSQSERVDGPDASTRTTAGAHVRAGQLSTHVEVRDVPAEGWGLTQWSRGYSLAAGESFTFAGLATLAIAGDVAPLDAVGSVGDLFGPSSVLLRYQDRLGRAGFAFEAWTTSVSDATGMFTPEVGADGRISLTITNTGTEILHGGLHLSTSVHSDAAVAGPVPEPSAWMLMLGGAALVGSAARRRASSGALVPA